MISVEDMLILLGPSEPSQTKIKSKKSSLIYISVSVRHRSKDGTDKDTEKILRI